MKRIALVLTIVILGTAAFAAKLPTQYYKAADTQQASQGGMKMGAGVTLMFDPTTVLGYTPVPTLVFVNPEGSAWEVGGTFATANGNTSFQILGKGNFPLYSLGKTNVHLGSAVSYISKSATTYIFSILGLYGATAYINDNFSVSADIVALSYNTGKIAAADCSMFNVGSAMLGAQFYF